MNKETILFNAKDKALGNCGRVCNMISAGRAAEALKATWREQLETLQKDCGFRYMRFHGLFCDDMRVVARKDGRLVFNFQFVDEVFDFLLSKNIRPCVELAFMPEALASGDDTLFWYRANVTPPRDYSEWGLLVGALASHLVGRYGIGEVSQWYFEVWNEPNLNVFWRGTRSEYFRLYETSARALKEVSPLLRVGGPATSNFVPDDRFAPEKEDISRQITLDSGDLDALEWNPVWAREFLGFAKSRSLTVDFVSVHPYPTDFAFDEGSGATRGRTRGRDSLKRDIATLKRILEESGYGGLPIHFTEWNSSPTSRDYSHDYLQEAGYIAYSVISTLGEVESLSYWTFSDIFEEEGPAPEVFHGGFGLITASSIPKPAFNAMRMLSKLGGEIVGRTGGAVLTRRGDGRLALAMTNWPESVATAPGMSPYPDWSTAEAIEEEGEAKEFSIHISGAEPGAKFSVELLDNSHGNATRLWRDLGHPANLTRDEMDFLRAAGASTRKWVARADGEGRLSFSVVMEPWAVLAATQL